MIMNILVTPESSGSCSPESSAGDSPPSDLIHSSSANGIDDPSPAEIPSPPSPLNKLLQAIDEDRINVPLSSETKMKILRWLGKQDSSKMVSSLYFCSGNKGFSGHPQI